MVVSRMSKEEMDNTFTTLDAYLAGFLTLKGFVPQLIQEKANKVVFAFNVSEGLYQGINAYNSGAIVEASRLAFAVKTLKSQIHSMRRDKEKRYVELEKGKR
jgi:hypothetical protein